MSLIKNVLGLFVPVREQRRLDNAASPFVANLAELVMDVNGDESALCFLALTNFNGSIELSASPDGTNYGPVWAMPYAAVGGNIPIMAKPLFAETFATVSGSRTYAIKTTGMRKIRIRVTGYAGGSAIATFNADPNSTIHPQLDSKAPTDTAALTGAAGAAVLLNVGGVTWYRHYIHRISVVRNASVALVAGAAPINVTVGNINGSPILSFGSDAAAQGTDREQVLEFGADGIATTSTAQNTGITCPATPGVIWRVNVAYRFGL